MVLKNRNCPACGKESLVPALYGLREPKRDWDLFLAGKVGKGCTVGERSALWICAECYQPDSTPGRCAGEDEVEQRLFAQTLKKVLDEYTPLEESRRRFLYGRFRLLAWMGEAIQHNISRFEVLLEENAPIAKGYSGDEELAMDGTTVEVFAGMLEYLDSDQGRKEAIEQFADWNVAIESHADGPRIIATKRP